MLLSKWTRGGVDFVADGVFPFEREKEKTTNKQKTLKIPRGTDILESREFKNSYPNKIFFFFFFFF